MISRQTMRWILFLFAFMLVILPGCGGGSGGDAAPVPLVTTLGASSVSVDNAVLNGNVNPNGLATAWWFEWGTSPTLATYDNTSAKPAGSGTTTMSENDTITGLTLGTTYYYRLVASNSAGTTRGAITSLTTPSPMDPPTVQTYASDNLSVTAATLHGSVIPNGLATTAYFEWGADNTFANPNVTSFEGVGSDDVSHQVNTLLTGLTENTIYYYRVVASNAAGTSRGLSASFQTHSRLPTVTTLGATSVTVFGASLNGTVNPNGLATDAYFEYGTSPTLVASSTTSSQPLGSGLTDQSVAASLTGLTAGTTYYYRVVATNSAGTTTGEVVGFDTIAQPPNVATAAATSVTSSGVSLNGTVNPNGLATDAYFEYGTSPTLAASSATSTHALGSGGTDQSIVTSLDGLTSGTTYYYRVAATNSAGTSRGDIVNFNTLVLVPQPPAVDTAMPTSVTTIGATLNGNVNPEGLATDAYFEWGTSPTLATSTPTGIQTLGPGFTNRSVVASLTGLSTGTTYYYRVVATNSAGTSNGTVFSFTPRSLPVLFLDDFSSDTTGSYNVFTSLGTGTFTYNAAGQNAAVVTGDGETVIFNRLLPSIPNSTAVFSLVFSPTSAHGSGGDVSIRLMDTPTTFFELSTRDALVTKVRKGVIVDSAPFPFSYSQGGTYTIRITFSQTATTFEAFGGTANLTTNDMSNPVIYFEVATTQQDAYFDNIKLEAAP